MIFCARATRGLRRPSLDARIGRPNRPPSREKEKQARKHGTGRGRTAWMVPFARRVRTIRICSLDARSEGQPGYSSWDRRLAGIYGGLIAV
jgi:hypothetical protein